MSAFILGVVSSLVASALLVIVGWLGTGAVRRQLIRILSGLTGLGVRRVYATQRDANHDLRADLESARWVKVFAGRGNELTRDSFMTLWSGGANRLSGLHILLPAPASSWLQEREAETGRHDRGYGEGLLSEQVRGNIKYVQAQSQHTETLELRLYDFPHLCRIIATDRVAYLTVYSASEHGRNSPCYVFDSDSPMYGFAVRVFDLAWAKAVEAPGVG